MPTELVPSLITDDAAATWLLVLLITVVVVWITGSNCDSISWIGSGLISGLDTSAVSVGCCSQKFLFFLFFLLKLINYKQNKLIIKTKLYSFWSFRR